ncbi:MAG: 1,4-alpha-glucan (glycogen) branching enzyme, GH-13-type [Candidatus Ozemobacter sibiricus]|jgi:1,4-alpha-glucan branching enzyme|uniref:1,4-alpha-glucan branching enzyme GlgB n=1 Tax=Candidatus Ozemobacter sibiricus TaxID=2268124 RepID=A0A367ZPS4_9BACT|nr:MAG: 1,4-alpha-glucan (glycogen) branching enzyme, GH-13-type [Candidatus Ozemobacter sibiricus]
MSRLIDDGAIEAIIRTDHYDPFQILGMHQVELAKGRPGLVVRAFLPDAGCAQVVDIRTGQRFPMKRLHPAGFFEGIIEERSEPFPYRLGAEYSNGATTEFFDSYSFLPTLGEMDTYLFNEGNHHQIYEKLGAHLRVVRYYDLSIGGIAFSVWAPNAKRVSVIGDFNHWDGRRHVMRSLGSSGIWEIFVPGLQTGQNYKFEIKLQNGALVEKCDPYAFYAEVRPKTASRIFDIDGYEWHDQDWVQNRGRRTWRKEPISIYECHLGSWMRVWEEGNRFLTYRELAPKLAEYVKSCGYTHVELLPITEHPLDISWGYQVTGFFAPTSRFGNPKDFMFFVDHMHQNGIGVILDWVPAHFPKDAHGLARFDGTALYEHADPRLGEHKDWSTYIFNFGRNEVKNFLISSALFWLDKYHIDGLRVDAVASMLYLDYSRRDGEWIPNRYGGRENLEAIEFLKYLNSITHEKFPGTLMIAEESTAFPGVSKPCYMGGLGFGFKWNMGWMHDTLEYFQKDPIHRKYHHNNLTFPLIYAFHENFISVLSHDEVVHGKGSMINKMPGDFWQKFANLRLLYSFMWTMPGKKLIFMGSDFGQWNEWNCNQSLDWHLLGFQSHQGLQRLMAHLNWLYRTEGSLHQRDHEPEGFEWIDFSDADASIVSWLRRGDHLDDITVFVGNFTPVPREGYRMGVPRHGFYREILNSDSELYFGSNMGNAGGVWSEDTPWQNRPCSIRINLPPLALVGFKP